MLNTPDTILEYASLAYVRERDQELQPFRFGPPSRIVTLIARLGARLERWADGPALPVAVRPGHLTPTR